ncbi:hypothetical protein [Neolewinella agarilytica]|uniref:Uncharacterized protein n=1 Tax=Neolewinella agarilytica TaxID=478744 RepID=A0A1H9D423_9BACT|nr:hypothetical protein [Neolewinella agarilytica]SEQ08099.1 hypothetical protein SAMN05444359_105135 [Neolewinella agarilytica]
MRKIQTTPKHRAFYNEHGGHLPAYYTIANIGQLLSAASLSLAVFTLLSDAIAGRGISVASTGIVTAAILIGIFIELANRKLARPSIRPWVVKNQFSEDPEKQHRHKLVTRFSRAGLLLVGVLSFALSFMGSMDAGKLITDEAPPANLDSLQLAFAADTAVLFAPYQIRAAAALQQFNATKSNREKAAEDYAGCADRGNKWCKKKRRAILAEIDAAEAAYNATAATIATERGKALSEALKARDDANHLATAEAAEAAALVESEAKNTGWIFAALTFAGQLIFYLLFYLILQIEAGSEIAEEIEPNEFHALPSVWSDFKAVFSHRVERGARRLMAYVFGTRDRLEKDLPYVSFWTDTRAEPIEDAPPLVSSHTKTEPRFYQAAEDPHTHKPRATFNTQNTPPTHTRDKVRGHTNATQQDPETKKAYSRLMQYRKRLGAHQQKASAQLRKDGQVKARTAEAIANNRQWVEHYEGLLKALTEK